MFKIILLNLAIVACCLSASGKAELSDDEINKLVTKMCDKPDYPHDDIKTITDMKNFADFVQNMYSYERRGNCRSKYYSSIGDMRQLLAIREDDVCDEFKIRLMENYNQHFLATTTKAKKVQKFERRNAPAMMKVFFMHFANKIASTCKQALLEKVKTTDFAIVDANGQPKDVEKLDRLLREFVDNFVSTKEIDRTIYDEMHLPWKMIDDMHIREKEKEVFDSVIKDCYWDPRMECNRLHIRMNNANFLRMFQHSCQTNLRPAYKEHILAVSRLIAMGFYTDDEPLAKELAVNKNLRRMFNLAQVCETILRIKAFEDDSLDKGKVVALTLNNAKFWEQNHPTSEEPPELPFKIIYEKSESTPSLADQYDVDLQGDSSESKALVDTIVSNRKRHEEMVTKLMTVLTKRVHGHAKSKTGSLLALAQFSESGPATEVEIEQVHVEKVPLTFRQLMKKIGHSIMEFIEAVAICIGVTLFVAAIVLCSAGG